MGLQPATAQHLGSGRVGQTVQPSRRVLHLAVDSALSAPSIHPSVGDTGLEGECKGAPST
eukprot:11781485-Karenia_brevis.AAC.1